jgi:hypothetical protein
MGACDYENVVIGKYKDASEAFRYVVNEARYYHGHGGYTGTIAEKGDFRMITLPPRKDPYKYADELMDSDSQVNDKWGPANCIEIKGKRLKELRERNNLKGKRGIKAFLFFGWASS